MIDAFEPRTACDAAATTRASRRGDAPATLRREVAPATLRRGGATATSRARVARAAFALALVFGASGCAGWTRWPWGTTQRWPAPMTYGTTPLPPGEAALFEEGPEEVLVLRHADPVKVRPAGLSAGYPLTFYQKSVRVHAGSAVSSSSGGRVEVLWTNGNSIVVFDEGDGVVGSPSRGQPSFVFLTCDRARIDLKEPDQIELLGGARLSASSGPYVLERLRGDILRVSNQSKTPGEVLYRDAVIRLDPGQIVDLALLSAGGHPVQSDPGLQTTDGPGYTIRWSGTMEFQREKSAVSVRSLGEHEIQANGVRVRLERDAVARFEGLEPDS